ncbi:MAG: SBBP repeat-containing protein, partial [Deltaproteobacteria bacterium]|nr:SBBP repeat-containing protein [Deltaproteobacteria bacterium]
SSGNVYLTGDTDGILGSASNGETDAFVAKLDTDGALQWAEQLGTGAEDWSYGIALDSEGSVHISGYTAGTLSGNVSMGTTDYFIAKYDNDGQYQWALQDGRDLEDWSFALAIDSFDNIYATGVTHALLPNRASSEDIFIARYGDNAVTSDLYTVGGTVTGVIGTFTLTNNAGDTITIEASGSFTFPTGLPDGASYNVEAWGYQSQAMSCTVSGGDNGDGTGVIPGANVTNIVVACSEV